MISPQKTADILNIFNAQGAMKLIGARLTEVEEGIAEFELDFRPELSQQNGYFHAGIIATMLGGMYRCDNLLSLSASTWTLLPAPPRTEKHPASITVLNDGKVLCSYSGRRTTAFTASSGAGLLLNV